MAVYFYYRCSTDQQDATRQKNAALEAGVLPENIYGDHITGVSNYGDRPQYSKMVSLLQPFDQVITEDLTRYGRSMVLMLVEINKLLEMQVHIKTLDGRLDTQNMPAEIVKLIVGVMGYASECELLNLKRRTEEGRAVARSRNVKFGKKRVYDQHVVQEIMIKRNQGQGYGQIGKSMGISRGTIQKIVKRENAVVGIQ